MPSTLQTISAFQRRGRGANTRSIAKRHGVLATTIGVLSTFALGLSAVPANAAPNKGETFTITIATSQIRAISKTNYGTSIRAAIQSGLCVASLEPLPKKVKTTRKGVEYRVTMSRAQVKLIRGAFRDYRCKRSIKRDYQTSVHELEKSATEDPIPTTTPSTSPPTTTTVPPTTTTTTTSPTVALQNWWLAVGTPLVTALANDDTAESTPGIDESTLRAECVQFGDDVLAAQASVSIPATDFEAEWKQALAELGLAESQCVSDIDDGSALDASESSSNVLKGVQDLATAVDGLKARAGISD
jgi:hypothetical protein